MPTGRDYDGSIVAVLEQLLVAARLDGAAVLDLSQQAGDSQIPYSLGVCGAGVTDQGRALLIADPARPSHCVTRDGRPLLACPWTLPPARPGGLLLWREPGSPPWTDADHDLAGAVGMLLRATIGDGMGQVGIDRLTGLPNRRWFLEEVDRHIDRLDRDAMVGTLLLVDIDAMRNVNLTLGRDQGDRVLIHLASQLRTMIRPADAIARVGDDRFAVWQDGMDHLTAAERADSLSTRRLFQHLPAAHGVSFSIGIASRRPGSTEDVRTLLRRAHMATREVKAKGGGGWRVAQPQPVRGYCDRSP